MNHLGLKLTSQDGIDFNEDSHSGKIFIVISMALQQITARILDLRTLIIVSALISLCVSNNVGPCFLPLPAVADWLTEHRPNPQNNTLSKSSSRNGTDSFRVPMMGQAQKRADKEYQAQPIVASSTAGILLPDDASVAAERSIQFIRLPSASALQPHGRAPPRSV